MKTIEEITKALAQPFPQYEATREQSGQTLTYIPWYHVNAILDEHAPGWDKTIVKVERFQGRETSGIEDLLMVTVKIAIPYKMDGYEGVSYTHREQVGFERFKERNREGVVKELAYGDVFSNAMSMALRRAAADFGVGRYLYDKKSRQQAAQGQDPRPAQVQQQPQGAQTSFQGTIVTSNPENLVTPRQLAAIRAIANSIGENPDAVCGAVLAGASLEELTRAAASWLIDYLKRQAGQALGAGQR